MMSNMEASSNESVETMTSNAPRKWNWINVCFFALIHLHALYFIYPIITSQVFLSTVIFQLIVGKLALLGMLAGSHRLWSHKSFKARAPLRIFLAFLHTLTFSGSVYLWVRTHRVHHKYLDTDADPHNSKKGFIYCHMLWLLLETHPEVAKREKTINMKDIRKDWVVMLQKKYYFTANFIVTFLLPALVPIYLWGEAPLLAWCSSVCRCTLTFHAAFCINSLAHMFGSRPYNRDLSAIENSFVSVVSGGEGWHNYHHTFPWDYKAEEFGHNGYNTSAAFIKLCAKLGLAYDLKYPSEQLVRKHKIKAQNMPAKKSVEIYGWGDADMEEEDTKLATRENC